MKSYKDSRDCSGISRSRVMVFSKVDMLYRPPPYHSQHLLLFLVYPLSSYHMPFQIAIGFHMRKMIIPGSGILAILPPDSVLPQTFSRQFHLDASSNNNTPNSHISNKLVTNFPAPEPFPSPLSTRVVRFNKNLISYKLATNRGCCAE